MNRRNFLNTTAVLSAASTLPLNALSSKSGSSERCLISEIEFWQLSGMRNASEGFVGWIQSNPSQIFEESQPNPANWKEEKEKQPYSALYIKILTKDGLEGVYGPIDTEAAIVIERQLKSRLIGMDALAGELVWDTLLRHNRHSRASHYMMAISAVDNALWDLRGKYFNAPVYQLLGGPTRKDVEFYASCLGFSVEPEAVKKRCVQIEKQGFRYQKWFFAYGSRAGTLGLKKNIELVKVLRETLGDDTDLMFDAFMGWDFDFALSWAKQVEQYHPRWIEEAFMPAQIELFEKLAKETTIPVATGEHIYNRWETLDYLKTNSLSVVQTDPEWCGGVTELTKICNLASAFGVQVIPHGHNLKAAMHVIASQSPSVCPFGEYLINKMDNNYMFEKNPPVISNGRIALSVKPGFGIEWDESKIMEKKKMVF